MKSFTHEFKKYNMILEFQEHEVKVLASLLMKVDDISLYGNERDLYNDFKVAISKFNRETYEVEEY